jgi:ribosomal protein S18 acetylase RimI-like enzyme
MPLSNWIDNFGAKAHVMQITHLTSVSIDDLFLAFSDAFSDYERTWTEDEFHRMLHRRAYEPSLSFGAFDNGKLVSFTFNGAGMYNGKQTAYDAGTGTIKEYRKQGLSSRIFAESLPHLKNAGIIKYVLEVLQYNSAAISIYTKAGFRISKELSYFIADQRDTSLKNHVNCELREIELATVYTAAVFHDFQPSWQNSFDAISRELSHFRFVGAYDGNELIGYGIIEPATGDIPQLAVQQEYRRQGVGSAILRSLLRLNQHTSVKIINAEAAYEPMSAFFQSNGIPLTGKQFEMVLDL